jgi:hypothetical protein
MEKINFEKGTQVSPAKVMIDNIEHEVTPAVWKGNTPLSPFVLNKLQDNIENAIENKRLKLEGKSEQETSTQGRNICPNKWELGEYNQSGEKNDTTERVRIPYLVPCKSNTIYYVNMFLSNSTYDIKFILRSYDKSKAFIKNYSTINNATTFTTGTDECYLGITIYDVKSTTSDILNLIKTGVIKPFICLNSETDKTYTEFVPDSPSPEYPSRIRNVGDNINLAEYIKNLWFNNTSLKFLNAENTYGFVAKVSPNTQYIINKKYIGNRFVVVSSSTYPQNNTDIVRIISASNHNLTQYKFNTQANEKYIFLGVYVGTDEEELKKAIKEVKIEEGSTATSYTPYGCGSIDYAIEDTSNNIFNKDTDIELDGQYRTYKSGNIATNQYYYGVKEKVKGNKEYKVFSYQDYSNLCYFDKDMNYLSGELFGKNAKAIIFKTPSNCEYITLAVSKSGINKFSITEAKTTHCPLSKGQVIHKDDYIMNNRVHQNRKTVTLTGNETITRRGYVDSTNKTYRYSIELGGRDTSSRTNLICSHLPVDDQYSQNKSLVFGGGSNEGNIVYFQFVLDEIGVTDVTKISDYLKSQYENGTPVIVEYKLAKEIVTPLAKEQIEALYELQKAKYVDKMELTCLNEIEPTLVDIEKSLEESLLDVEKLLAILSLNS